MLLSSSMRALLAPARLTSVKAASRPAFMPRPSAAVWPSSTAAWPKRMRSAPTPSSAFAQVVAATYPHNTAHNALIAENGILGVSAALGVMCGAVPPHLQERQPAVFRTIFSLALQ